MTGQRDKEPSKGLTSMSSGATHTPMEALWATFVDYMRENVLDIEAIDAESAAFARKRSRRLAVAAINRLGEK